MPYLFLHVLCLLGFNQVIGYGQKRGLPMLPMVVINYAAAAGVASLLFLFEARAFSWVSMAMGILNGFLYVLHVFILISAFRAAGIGISAAVTNSCVVVPALFSFFFWLEPMTPQQWIAVALLPFAMLMLRPQKGNTARLTFRADFLLVASFVAGGLIASIHKAQQVYGMAGSQALYRACLFATAAAASFVLFRFRRGSFAENEIRMGAILGAFNIGSLVFLLLAIRHTPAVVLFPVSGCLAIVLNVALAHWLWREELIMRQFAGIGLSVAIIILANQVR